MSRSFTYLRRTLFGASCAVVFGFGATQALAAPLQARSEMCSLEGTYLDPACWSFCNQHGFDAGECTNNSCWCYLWTGS
jgi:hypothetical protein